MNSPFPFVIGLAVAGVIGWQGLQYLNPEAARDFAAAARLLTGKSCAPNIASEPPETKAAVFFPLDDSCKPVAALVPAPQVQGEGDGETVREIVLTMANPLGLGIHREVRIERRYQANELVPEGDAMPATAAKRNDMIVKWLGRQQDEACALLPTGFAATCRPMTSRTKVDLGAIEAGQAFDVSFSLTYAPAQPIGPLPEAGSPARLYSDEVMFAPDAAQPLAAQVEAATRRALAECDTRRTAHGNCMVSRISLSRNGESAITLNWIEPAVSN